MDADEVDPDDVDLEEVTAAEDPDELPSVDRLLALTDGVVAIALTLLVLQLVVPALAPYHGHTVRDPYTLFKDLNARDFGAQITAYLVSFYVIGQFWLAHHRVFRSLRGHDEGLAWLNFVFLFSITLVPFVSALLGRWGGNPLAVTLFAADLLLASLALQAVRLYGARHHLQTGPDEPLEARAAALRTNGAIAIIAASIVVAWFSPDWAPYLWLLLVVPQLVSARWVKRQRALAAAAA